MNVEKEVRPSAIVLIDDDIVVHFIFEKLINILYPNKPFLCFSSASEALGLLASERLSTDLIVLDIDMPSMDGWTFLSELSRLGYTKPVCMLSSSCNPRDVTRAKSFPIVREYVIKPLDRQNIDKIVRLCNGNH